jgi:hypothetical protein
VNVGGYQGLRARPGFRAAVNARLEEISFRTGLITATIALVALSAIVAAGVYVAALGHSSPIDTARVSSVGSAPVKTLAAPASVLPRTPTHSQASPKPKAQQPVTAGTTSPQPVAGSQPLGQAGSSGQAGPQVPSRDYGRAGAYGHGPGHGGYGPRDGGYGNPGQGPGPGPGPVRIGGMGGLGDGRS